MKESSGKNFDPATFGDSLIPLLIFSSQFFFSAGLGAILEYGKGRVKGEPGNGRQRWQWEGRGRNGGSAGSTHQSSCPAPAAPALAAFRPQRMMWASVGGSAAAGTASLAAARQDTATRTPARTGCCTVQECSIGPVWRRHTAHNSGLGREVAHRREEVLDGHNRTMAVLCPYHCLYLWGRRHPSLNQRRSLSPSAWACGYSPYYSAQSS
ncbi:hypothetical protein C8R44DRAFT_733035 [Mycena epipterygia]|nr:hypothetical protein C8R44DRAFT_733035 [Mycena epipterygia]